MYMDYSVPDRKLEPDFVKEPQCPVCGDVCEKYYLMHNVIIGCDQCIEVEYAKEYELD